MRIRLGRRRDLSFALVVDCRVSLIKFWQMCLVKFNCNIPVSWGYWSLSSVYEWHRVLLNGCVQEFVNVRNVRNLWMCWKVICEDFRLCVSLCSLLLMAVVLITDSRVQGWKKRNEIELNDTKRNRIERNETKWKWKERNEMELKETKRNRIEKNETKWNWKKRNEMKLKETKQGKLKETKRMEMKETKWNWMKRNKMELKKQIQTIYTTVRCVQRCVL